MTTNVIQFAPRKTAQAAPAQGLTQYDKDLALHGEDLEYTLCAVLLTMSWAYQTGKIALGDKFLAVCRKHGWSPTLPLGKELGDALHAADFDISTRGTQEQRDAQKG